ncbi:hypothetical protein C8Q76DRAFT_481543 [Earliella scabrosa]|nr:hypothetical protein C8Q76DRAFT_481543 [Earliella scabrosa]
MANHPSQPQVPSEILLRIGPVLVGSLLSFMLFGISIVQLYIYYTSFPRDRSAIRVTVYSIFFLDIVQTVLAAGEAWDTLCAGWGRPINIQFPDWSYWCLPMVSGIVAAWVQIFYAWRIYQVGRWKLIPSLIVFFSLAQTGAASAISVSFGLLKDIHRLHDPNMFARTIIWLGGGSLVDITIMFSMVHLLYSAKRATVVFKQGELMINRLLRMSIETGSACALCATLELALFLGLPDTNLHFILALILSKVYSNTLMASLNARDPSAEHRRSARRTLSSLSFNNFPSLPNLNDVPQPPLPARVSREPAHPAKLGKDAGPKSWNLELNDLHASDEPLKEDFYRDGATPSLDADRDSGNKRQP